MTNIAVASSDTAVAVDIDPYTAGDDIVLAEPITVGETDVFTITVTFTVDATATEPADLDCELVEGEDGTGTLNTATVTFDGQTIEDDACAPIPEVTIDKTVTSAPAFAAGAWTVEYEVEVENTGAVDTTYDLEDVPTFGAGTNVTNIAVASALVDIDHYTAGDPIVSAEPITAGATHTFTITVTFTVDATATEPGDLDCELVEGEDGTGTLNTATVTFDGQTIEDDACAPIPEVTIDKTVTSAPVLAAGEWTVAYEVDVTNSGPITTTYDLQDVPSFGEGTTVTNIAVAATTPAVAIDPYTAGALIVDDESIDPGITHTYTVTVTFTVDTEVLTTETADCVIDTDETGTGTLNTATVTFSGGSLDDSACAPVPTGGGSGGGGGGDQPPTDMLAPTASLPGTAEDGGLLGGPLAADPAQSCSRPPSSWSRAASSARSASPEDR